MKGMIPTIIGLDPPNKEIIVSKNGSGFDVFICWAKLPKGTKPGPYKSDSFSEIEGVASWLRFTNPEVMRMFGETLIKAAKEEK